MHMKMNTAIADLCKGLPNEFHQYLEYVTKIEFTEEPNYNKIIKLFKDVFKRESSKCKTEDEKNLLDWQIKGK